MQCDITIYYITEWSWTLYWHSFLCIL